MPKDKGCFWKVIEGGAPSPRILAGFCAQDEAARLGYRLFCAVSILYYYFVGFPLLVLMLFLWFYVMGFGFFTFVEGKFLLRVCVTFSPWDFVRFQLGGLKEGNLVLS